MSGIFKSIKKVFKKVGKVIKKIAPYLIIAAGVYFGGSYLMSTYGGATSAAAGSAATSFTKSAGVWKSFLGGLSNGSAAQSAAAFAEGSYQASLGLNALPLSGQVLAGTSSVNALNGTLSTQQAVTAGVDLTKGAFLQAGGDAQAASNIVQKAWSQSQAINEQLLSVDAAGSSAISTLDSSTMAQIDKDMAWGGDIYQRALAKGGAVEQAATDVSAPTGTMLSGSYQSDAGILPAASDAKQMVGDISYPSGVDYSQQSGVITAAQQAAKTNTADTAVGTQGVLGLLLEQNRTAAATTAQYNKDYLGYLRDMADRRDTANKNQLMWSMAQTGLKAIGGYMTAKAEEKEAGRARNWSRSEDKPMWDPWSGEHRKGIITEQV